MAVSSLALHGALDPAKASSSRGEYLQDQEGQAGIVDGTPMGKAQSNNLDLGLVALNNKVDSILKSGFDRLPFLQPLSSMELPSLIQGAINDYCLKAPHKASYYLRKYVVLPAVTICAQVLPMAVLASKCGFFEKLGSSFAFIKQFGDRNSVAFKSVRWLNLDVITLGFVGYNAVLAASHLFAAIKDVCNDQSQSKAKNHLQVAGKAAARIILDIGIFALTYRNGEKMLPNYISLGLSITLLAINLINPNLIPKAINKVLGNAASFNQQLNGMKEDLGKLKVKVNLMRESIDPLRVAISALNAPRIIDTQLSKGLKGRLLEAQEKLKTLEQTIELQNKKIKELQQQCYNLEVENTQLKKENSDLTTQFSNLTIQFNALKEEKEKENRKCGAFEAQIGLLQETIVRLQQENERLGAIEKNKRRRSNNSTPVNASPHVGASLYSVR